MSLTDLVEKIRERKRSKELCCMEYGVECYPGFVDAHESKRSTLCQRGHTKLCIDYLCAARKHHDPHPPDTEKDKKNKRS